MSKTTRSLVVLALVSACGGSDADTAAGPALPPGAPAPAIGTPSTDEVTEAYGIFVTEGGADGGGGTRANPLATIGAAIAAAKPRALRVYVCKGTYREAVTVEDAVSIIGGYDCSDPAAWKRVPGARSSIAPAPGTLRPAVYAKDIVRITRVEGFDVKGADVSGIEGTAVGLHAERANALVVADSSIRAGAGADGMPGTAEPTPGPSAAGAAGSAGVYDYATPVANAYPYPGASAGGASASCGGGQGGAGGRGGVYKCEPSVNPNLPATLVLATRLNTITNTIVVIGNSTPATNGGAGSGAAGADGKSAAAPGRMAGLLFARSSGERGGDGQGGAGGAGGAPEAPTRSCSASRFTTLASGAGGGAGGCGGRAGVPGGGGGASIGVVSDQSQGLVFDGTSIEGGPGGKGGAGTFGSDPVDGGEPGATALGAEPGGAQRGRPGGRAGVGGSGAGGSSFGLVHLGPAPKLTNGSFAKAGPAGPGVEAMTKGFTMLDDIATIPASVAGEARDVVPTF